MNFKLFMGDGATVDIPLHFDDPSYDPSSAVGIFTAKLSDSDADDQALIQKVTGAGLEFVSTAAGWVARLEFVRDDTVDLRPGFAVYDVQCQRAGESPRTAAKALLTLIRDVTRNLTTSVPVYTAQPPFPGGTPEGIAGVASVNGRAGVVVLDKTDVGLGNVDNTADLDKPVSTQQAAAIASTQSAAEAACRPADWVPGWEEVQSKPAAFPPSGHEHSIAGVIGLAASLAELDADASTAQATGNAAQAAVTSEAARAAAAEAGLSAALSSAVSDSDYWAGNLQQQIIDETNSRVGAVNAVTSQLNNETAFRYNADASLAAQINAEADRAGTVEANLSTDLAALQEAIDGYASGAGVMAADIATLQGADASLAAAISAETTARIGVEVSIEARVSVLEATSPGGTAYSAPIIGALSSWWNDSKVAKTVWGPTTLTSRSVAGNVFSSTTQGGAVGSLTNVGAGLFSSAAYLRTTGISQNPGISMGGYDASVGPYRFLDGLDYKIFAAFAFYLPQLSDSTNSFRTIVHFDDEWHRFLLTDLSLHCIDSENDGCWQIRAAGTSGLETYNTTISPVAGEVMCFGIEYDARNAVCRFYQLSKGVTTLLYETVATEHATQKNYMPLITQRREAGTDTIDIYVLWGVTAIDNIL